MNRIAQWLLTILVLLGLTATASSQQIFFEDFETGGPDWMPSNGIWEFGIPTAGPSAAHSGFQCAGTQLGGNYDPYADSRLEYPRPSVGSIQLPNVQGDEEIRLRYWNWFSYSSYDYGYTQVSYWDVANSAWSVWENVPHAASLQQGWNWGWHPRDVDLTPYAGMEIKIGFYHTADRSYYSGSESTGWYIDDVEIIKVVPTFSGDFESGWDYWTAEGIWDIGLPTAGASSGYLSDNCAGTNLGGDYHAYYDSRLMSPAVTLPTVSGSATLWLSYYQWWSYSSYDSGYVEVQSQDPQTLEWSAWVTLSGSTVSGVSAVWTPRDLELTAYAGQKIRVAFHHTADRSYYSGSESTGWYIDNVSITGVATPPRLPELDVKINGLDSNVNITTLDNAKASFALDTGDYGGVNVELWIGAITRFGTYWYDSATDTWIQTQTVYSQGPMVDLPQTVLFDATLPIGAFTFFLVLDTNPNGVVDITAYDTAEVNVQ